MRLIELTGLPGCGKSTILPIIKKYLKNRGFEIYDKQVLIVNCKEFPINKTFFTSLIKFFPIPFRDKILTLFYRILDINTSRGVFKIKFESKHKYDLIFPASNNSNQQIEKTDSKKIERFFK